MRNVDRAGRESTAVTGTPSEQVAIMLGLRTDQDQVPRPSGQIRSVKDGGNRRILPEWVDEYIRQRVEEQSA